uniref:M-phase phosphoprotein 9 n=1 Tax=Leptobrachium leishanense TaxID=445787 RepID=A0A8C5LWK9_9ANUR
MAWDTQWEAEDHRLSMDVSSSAKAAPDDSETLHDESPSEQSPGGGAVASEEYAQSFDPQSSEARGLCSRELIDPEQARKKCETPWLQLFQLVERQCQEQMVAQQEHFNHQIQVIRDEIKYLAQLQSGGSPQKSGTGEGTLGMANIASHLTVYGGSPRGDHENTDAIPASFSLHSGLDKQQKAFITQEQFVESTSISSGYGTHSISERNTCLSSYSQNNSRESRLPTQPLFSGSRSGSLMTQDSFQIPGDGERCFIQDSGKRMQLSMHDNTPKDVMTSSEQKGADATCDQSAANESDGSNIKPLTTWAQKLKKNHQKKSNQTDLISSQASQAKEGETLSQNDNTDSGSQTFYLNNRCETPNSLFSIGSGFTYWKLDEKDLYHPLPERIGNFHTKECEETRIPSLTDIYQRNQRECPQYPDWKPLSPSEYTHPPEVLTLDPTLHKKPEHRFVNCTQNISNTENVSMTPDSILDNSSIIHYDAHSVSTAASAPSLGESPTNSPIGDPQWEIGRYQNRLNRSYELSPGEGSCDERMLCTEDEAISLTPSSMPESPLTFTEENLIESNQIHPVTLSNIRRGLREKHSRHLSDLRDYYESEINNLKQQIIANTNSSTSEDLKKITSLSERCDHMESAVTEASKRIRLLENKNNELELLLVEWKERYQAVNKNSIVIKDEVEEMRSRTKERENSIKRLQSKLKETEEALEKAFRLSDDKDSRIKGEHKRFQDLLSEYQSHGKEHERVKDKLCVTENKLSDAYAEINELKRSVSKLEAQIKQMEHENTVKLRHITDSQFSAKAEMTLAASTLQSIDVAKRKCLTPGTNCSIFTGQPLDNKDCEMENVTHPTYEPNRYNSPPEKDVSFDYFPGNLKTKDNRIQESPILKALRDFEEEKVLKTWRTQSEKENAALKFSGRSQTIGCSDSFSPPGSSEHQKDRQRRVNSPSGPRSSSVPPSNRKPTAVTTPTKRELMLTPVTVKYSPKRSPSENLSPGLSQLLCSDENPMTRFDVVWDDSSRRKYPSPRKRLQFMSLEEPEVLQKSSSESQLSTLTMPHDTDFTYYGRVTSTADTERLFDDLSEEKQQIEAALSRMPSSGHRLSLQMRAKKEHLEDRLEKINRHLGSVRMILKKYHVLPSSANL